MTSLERFNVVNASTVLGMADSSLSFERYSLVCATYGFSTHAFKIENANHFFYEDFPELSGETEYYCLWNQ